MTKTLPYALSLAALAFAGAAQAHQIWIEPVTGQQAVVRFGEFAENVRESSPGNLDKLGPTRATLVGAQGDKTAAGSKTADGFTLPFAPAAGEAVVAEAAQYPLYKFKKADREMLGWYYPTARLTTDFAQQQPRNTLDLVPAGKPGEMQVFFRGKPLAKAKVALVTQSGWAKEKQTDEQGKVAFDLPWKGLYVAEVTRDDTSGGERQGPNGLERYNTVNYVATLAWVKQEGLEPVPVPVQATAGK